MIVMKKTIINIIILIGMVIAIFPIATVVTEAATPESNCLCFTAEQPNSSVKLIMDYGDPDINFEYKKGDEWLTYTIGDEIQLNNIGNKVYFRNVSSSGTTFSGSGRAYRFVMEGKIAASGDVTTLINKNGTRKLFEDQCFHVLFQNCTSLTKAPELPATELTNYCYQWMFAGCTGLTEAPALPATELATGSYFYMFEGCTNLIKAPVLPATEMTVNCYYSMFENCTSLEKAPVLPATKMTISCYYSMFENCTSLEKAPAIPAKDLAYECFRNMFKYCKNLNYIAFNHNASYDDNTYRDWMEGVSSNGTFICPSYYYGAVGEDRTIPLNWTIITSSDGEVENFTVDNVNAYVGNIVEIKPAIVSTGIASYFDECLVYSMSTADAEKIAVVGNSDGIIKVKVLKEGSATLKIWNSLNSELSADCQISAINKTDSSISEAPTLASNLTYTGNPQSLLSSDGVANGGTMKYFATTDSSDSEPSDQSFELSCSAISADTYYVWYYISADIAHNDSAKIRLGSVKINKADSSISEAPTLVSDLTYTGNPQNLLSSDGIAKGGTMKYCVRTDSSDSEPDDEYFELSCSAISADTYYVWYYVSADANYNNSAKTMLGHVKINKKESKPKWRIHYNDYTVRFDMGGHGEDIKIDSNMIEKRLKEIEEPRDEGYIFCGWYKDSAFKEAWDFQKDVITASTTLYAKWYKISNAKFKKLKAGKNSFTVTVKKLSSTKSNGYQLRYSTKKKMDNAVVKTIGKKNSKVTKKIGKLKSRKTYYVQVRTIKKYNGKTYYSVWDKTRKIKIK